MQNYCSCYLTSTVCSTDSQFLNRDVGLADVLSSLALPSNYVMLLFDCENSVDSFSEIEFKNTVKY